MELDSDGVAAASQTQVGFEVLWLFGRHSKFRLLEFMIVPVRTDRSWGPGPGARVGPGQDLRLLKFYDCSLSRHCVPLTGLATVTESQTWTRTRSPLDSATVTVTVTVTARV